MKKLILILVLTIFFSGCSFIPRLTFDSKGTTPQSIDKSRTKEICKGKAVFNENGDILSCSKGYYSRDINYEKKERAYTLKEKIINIFRAFSGYTFWIIIALIFLCPSLLGLIVGRIFNGANTLVDQLIRSIKKFRKTSNAKEELDNILREETDNKTKKIIATKRITLK